MRKLANIKVTLENGVFKVPADLGKGFVLVPAPKGRISLFFWERERMRRFLRNYGFYPSIIRRTEASGIRFAQVC